MNNIFYWLLFTAKNKLKAQQPVLKQLALTVVYVFFVITTTITTSHKLSPR